MQLFVKAFIALKHLHKQLTHGTEMAVAFYLLEKKKKKRMMEIHTSLFSQSFTVFFIVQK